MSPVAGVREHLANSLQLQSGPTFAMPVGYDSLPRSEKMEEEG